MRIPYQFSRAAMAVLQAAIFYVGLHPSSLRAQTPTLQGVNCNDPAVSNTPACQSLNSNVANQPSGPRTNAGDAPVYVDSAGNLNQQPPATNGYETFPSDPLTDFQRLARTSTGELLPVYGRDLFQRAPNTFAPGNQLAPQADYVLGPGDQVLVRLWGPDTLNSELTVDTSGSIYIPKVGSVHVAGLRFDELQRQISAQLSQYYRNYNTAISLGRLRSIQIYVVGEARRPGAYTVSALSTVLHALFVSGGPNVQGSLRRIELRRAGSPPSEFDLYDLIQRGDKSRDLRLQQGDTIFIPSAGPQVAVGGSVRHPAIYELRGETTLEDVLKLAGGLAPTASTRQVSLERIDTDDRRRAVTVALNAEGQRTPLRSGDVLFIDHITAGYEQSVTLRGNLANPGRFAWREGLRLSDILPDRASLLTNDYWRQRNQLGVPVPLFEPLDNGSPLQQRYLYPTPNGNGLITAPPVSVAQPAGSSAAPNITSIFSNALGGNTANAQVRQQALGATALGTSDAGIGTGYGSDASGVPAGQTAPGTLAQTNAAQNGAPRSPRNTISLPAPEINWSYAVIERLDPNTLKTSLVPFNLGKLVLDHDATQDLALQPGDVVTILSEADIPVPQDQRTKFVRLEGEFAGAGVYSVGPNDTLADVVARAGGLTSKAYLYGSSFERESARVFQQQRLDEYITQLSTDMERSLAVRTASSDSGIADPTALAEQRSLIDQLRQLRATGRIVLEFTPASVGGASIPRLPLENGDVFRVPSRPNTVSVVGAVYGQNVFLFNPDRRVQDYLTLAGKPNRIADSKHSFIIRADGSIFSRERAQGVWENRFNTARINPGDAIVVPEKLVKPTALRQLLQYSQVLSSFGLAAAAINVVR